MTHRLGLYEKALPADWALASKLHEAKAAGFDFLELSIDESDEKLARLDWSISEKQAVRRACVEEGIWLETICLSGHRRFPLGSEDPSIRARALHMMQSAIVLAAELGVRVIQIAGYDEYYHASNARTRQFFEENLRTSVDCAAAYGVILAFETMETDFMNTVEKAMRYVSSIQSPYLQVYPDLGNITNAAVMYGKAVEQDLRLGAGHLAAMHLKETKPGIFREVPYGTGHVNFALGIKTAMALGVRLFVAECWHTGSSDGRAQINAAHQFLSAFFI